MLLFRHTRRREFIAVLGGAVITWPLNGSAQSISTPLVGFVHARSRDETTGLVAAFQKGLTETGYIDGQTVITELHFAGGQYDQLPQMFSDLVSRNAAFLVAGADPAAVAAKRTTQTVPSYVVAICYFIGFNRFGFHLRFHGYRVSLLGIDF